jgi:hypothetical protein
MLKALHTVSGAALVAAFLVMSGTAAQSQVLVYGSPENCPVGAICAPTKMRFANPFAMANDHGSEVGSTSSASDSHGGGGGCGAARDDEQGVLVLSSFAGASRELSEALIVNPYDTRAMADALATALTMPESEQRDRLVLMREIVRQRNVHRWAAQMLIDASDIRKRERIPAQAFF